MAHDEHGSDVYIGDTVSLIRRRGSSAWAQERVIAGLNPNGEIVTSPPPGISGSKGVLKNPLMFLKRRAS